MTLPYFDIDLFKWYPDHNILVGLSRDAADGGHYSQGIMIEGRTKTLFFRRCHADYEIPLNILQNRLFYAGGIHTYVHEDEDKRVIHYAAFVSQRSHP